MQKYEMNKYYQEILNNPSKDSNGAIDYVEQHLAQNIDRYEQKRIAEIKAECERQRGFNRAQAQETRIVVSAYLDADNPMHDFSVKYVDALRAKADTFKDWD